VLLLLVQIVVAARRHQMVFLFLLKDLPGTSEHAIAKVSRTHAGEREHFGLQRKARPRFQIRKVIQQDLRQTVRI
jgi:hypothetical protein